MVGRTPPVLEFHQSGKVLPGGREDRAALHAVPVELLPCVGVALFLPDTWEPYEKTFVSVRDDSQRVVAA